MPSFFHSFLSVGPANAQVLDFLPDHISSKKSQFFSITSEHSGPMVFELQEAAVEFQRSLGNGLTKSVDASCCCRESLGTITSAGTLWLLRYHNLCRHPLSLCCCTNSSHLGHLGDHLAYHLLRRCHPQSYNWLVTSNIIPD